MLNTYLNEFIGDHHKSLLLLKQLDLNKLEEDLPDVMKLFASAASSFTVVQQSRLRQVVSACESEVQKSFYLTDATLLLKANELLETTLFEIPDQTWSMPFHALGRHVDWLCIHSLHVALIALILSLELQVETELLRPICAGALLHDLGKLLIPRGILQKPGKLTSREQRLMRKHCELGYLLTKKLDLDPVCQRIALLHHEGLDGSGYPLGLSAGLIPEEIQIVAVADLIGAITTYRPYRQQQSLSIAAKELKRCKAKYSKQLTHVMEKYVDSPPQGQEKPKIKWKAFR